LERQHWSCTEGNASSVIDLFIRNL
jgi:hypothetical protein